MRLEFNILWFENQPEDVATQMDEIKEHTEAAGFRANLFVQPNADDLDALAQRQEKFHDFDLVVIDWDLGGDGMQGDELAHRCRTRFGFTDIVFYSGKRPNELREMVYTRGIDGVYCMSRGELVASLTEHIDEVVKRLSRLEAMRGVSVGAVGRCDEMLRTSLRRIYAGMDGDARQEADDYLAKCVASGAEAGKKGYDTCNTFDDRLDCRSVTSFTLWKVASHLVKRRGDLKQRYEILKRYNDEALEPRNRLGHAVEEQGQDGWIVASETKPAIGQADFPKLRRDLLVHLDNLSRLSDDLLPEVT